MFLVSFWIYPSYTEIQKIWSYIDINITCLKELLVTLEIIRRHWVRNNVSIWHMAARKLCIVVDSQVKIWFCMLSYKNCHQTRLCLQRHFGTVLTVFANLSIILILITSILRKWRIVSLFHPHWKVSRTSVSLMWEIWKQLKVLSCVFPYQNLICYFSIWWKEVHH